MQSSTYIFKRLVILRRKFKQAGLHITYNSFSIYVTYVNTSSIKMINLSENMPLFAKIT